MRVKLREHKNACTYVCTYMHLHTIVREKFVGKKFSLMVSTNEN